MLHDKANWPTINLPSSQGLQYPPHMIARQQAAAAAAQMQMGASPIKNVPDRNQHRRGASNMLEPSLEEEEDVSRGDMLDFMTPRDISRMRYEQHHEWMEEIMSSPFAMKQIVPTDLGLGRKGELEALTNGYFDTPTSVLQETSANASRVKVGRMELTKAEEFTAKAAKKVAEMEAELENLKKRHSRRMAKLDKSSTLNLAEKRLRSAAVDGGRRSVFLDGEGGGEQRVRGDVDDIVRDVETATGKKIVPVSIVECVQRGGLEAKLQSAQVITPNEKSSPDKSSNASQHNDSNHENLGASMEVPSPNIQQQQQEQSSVPSPQASQPVVTHHGHEKQRPITGDPHTEGAVVLSLDEMDVDVEMAGLESDNQQGVARIADIDGNEWVLVDNMNANAAKEVLPAERQISHEPTKQATASPGANAASGFANTPTGSGIQGLTPAEPSGEGLGEAEAMDESGFDLEQGDFETHLEATGDDLVDFGDGQGDLNLEGMDDSAFGDAFHPSDENQAHVPEHGDMS